MPLDRVDDGSGAVPKTSAAGDYSAAFAEALGKALGKARHQDAPLTGGQVIGNAVKGQRVGLRVEQGKGRTPSRCLGAGLPILD